MNDESKINLDAKKLFPEVARRMQILEALKSAWPSIVGTAAKYSRPYDLILNDLYVEVKNQQTAQRTMQTSTAVSNAAGNPPAVNTAALRQQAANVTANKAKYANTEQFKTYLADWMNAAQQQQTNRIDYATRQGVNALNQAASDFGIHLSDISFSE